MKTRNLGAVFVLFLLAGCLVGPDFERPATELEPSYATASMDSSFNNTEVISKWWENFGDETLVGLIEDAITNNHDIEIALARVQEARSLRREAFQDLFPGARSFGEHTSIRNSSVRQRGEDFDNSNDFFSAGLDALWEIDLFGTQRRVVEMRRAEEEGREAELSDALCSLSAEVALTYVELRGLQARLSVARQNASNQRKTAELVKNMNELGRGTELDSSRALAQLGATEASVPDLEASERVAMHRIAVLTARQPGALIDSLQVVKPIPTYSGPVSLGSPGLLLQRRPDVRIAERKLAAATAGVGVAYGELFPQLSFRGTFSFEANAFDDLGSSASSAYNYGPSISWIALDLGRIFMRIGGAKARLAQALPAYQQSVLLALEDTENSLVRFSKEKQRRDLLLMASKHSRRAAELAEVQYREGATDLLTVLDADRSALQAENSAVISESTLVSALIGIYKALGGGWE